MKKLLFMLNIKESPSTHTSPDIRRIHPTYSPHVYVFFVLIKIANTMLYFSKMCDLVASLFYFWFISIVWYLRAWLAFWHLAMRRVQSLQSRVVVFWLTQLQQVVVTLKFHTSVSVSGACNAAPTCMRWKNDCFWTRALRSRLSCLRRLGSHLLLFNLWELLFRFVDTTIQLGSVSFQCNLKCWCDFSGLFFELGRKWQGSFLFYWNPSWY